MEVARVGERIGTNGTQLRQLEVALVQLEDVASHRSVRERDAISDAAWDDADLVGADEQATQLRLDVEYAVLWDDEEVAVCRIEGFVCSHVFSGSVDEVTNPRFHSWVTRAGDEVQRVHPVHCLVEVKGVPPQLVGDEVDLLPRLVFGVCVECAVFAGLEVAVAARGEDTVEP